MTEARTDAGEPGDGEIVEPDAGTWADAVAESDLGAESDPRAETDAVTPRAADVPDLEIPEPDLPQFDRGTTDVPEAAIPAAALAEPVIPPPVIPAAPDGLAPALPEPALPTVVGGSGAPIDDERPATRIARRSALAAASSRPAPPSPAPAAPVSGGYGAWATVIWGLLILLLIGAVVAIGILLAGDVSPFSSAPALAVDVSASPGAF